MWAEMFMEILRNNHIPCTAFSSQDIGISIKTGMRRGLKIFVPADKKLQAEELLEEIFSGSAASGQEVCAVLD